MISNKVAFWHEETQTSLCSLLLSLTTPNNVRSLFHKVFWVRCGTNCFDSWHLPSSLLFILTQVPTHKKYRILCYIEPQISHIANFTPCEELVPILHFWKMWILRLVNFDNFGCLQSMLKFHIFLILNCEELVRIRAICEGLVRFFSDVKNWYSIFTNVKNWYQFFTPVKNWYAIFTNVKSQYQMLTDVKNWYQFFTDVKNWYQIFTDVKNWYIIFIDVNDRNCNI